MSIHRLRFTGHELGACVLGGPLVAHFGDRRVGVLHPVPISRDGREIRIEHFTPADSSDGRRFQRLQIGRVMLLEIVAFVAVQFPAVTLIRISLARDLAGAGTGFQLATQRAALLQAIGARAIRITPQPDAARMGHFAVGADWEYTRSNLEALQAALVVEWAAYDAREQEAALRPRRSRCWLLPGRRPPARGPRA